MLTLYRLYLKVFLSFFSKRWVLRIQIYWYIDLGLERFLCWILVFLNLCKILICWIFYSDTYWGLGLVKTLNPVSSKSMRVNVNSYLSLKICENFIFYLENFIEYLKIFDIEQMHVTFLWSIRSGRNLGCNFQFPLKTKPPCIFFYISKWLLYCSIS